MNFTKSKLVLSLAIWICIILSIPLLLELPFVVKKVGKNYIPVCDELQTELIKFLSSTGKIKPLYSEVKCDSGKIWKISKMVLSLPYGKKIVSVPSNIEKKFNLKVKQNKKEDYSALFTVLYKGIPIQKLEIEVARPKVAIIFDDVGENLSQVKDILKLGVDVTISVLPFLNYSKKSAVVAKKNGLEVMLHLPMEPYKSKVTSGIHTITTDMGSSEVKKWTLKSIKEVPYVKGVNNHMGSKATEDKKVMKNILEVLKSKNLYFIDSRTSSKSVAHKLAREMGVPSDINRCYLDNENKKKYIKKRLDLLIRRVLKRGDAIAIGHSRNKTIEVIKKYISKFKSEGILFVEVSEILNQKKEEL